MKKNRTVHKKLTISIAEKNKLRCTLIAFNELPSAYLWNDFQDCTIIINFVNKELDILERAAFVFFSSSVYNHYYNKTVRKWVLVEVKKVNLLI